VHRIRLVLVLAALAALCARAPGASASSSGIVVSQVYAAGGNSGALYQSDYVELLNTGSTTIDLTGWSVQYASASSTSWSATPLAGTVQAGHYFLVALGSSGSAGSLLPSADDTGATNLAVTGGKVAIVHDTAALTCGTSAGSCSAVATVADLVGYGTATDYEGSAAPAGSATLADLRGANGCTDTDVNGTDFTTGAPNPRSTAAAAASCSGASDASRDAGVALDVDPVLSVTLEHPSLAFGSAATGDTPAPLSERLTVVSNSATGYALTVHRTAFAPADLPLALATTAPSGGTVGASVAGGALARIPIAPAADLFVGTTSAHSAGSGDVWPATVGFASALPAVAPGHYTATITFTVVAR
jgi:uncharacterized protein